MGHLLLWTHHTVIAWHLSGVSRWVHVGCIWEKFVPCVCRMLLQFTQSTFSESGGQMQKPVLQNLPDNSSLWILVPNIPLRHRAPSQSPGCTRLSRDTHLSRHWLPWHRGIMETLNSFNTFAWFVTLSFQAPTFSRALQTLRQDLTLLSLLMAQCVGEHGGAKGWVFGLRCSYTHNEF